MRSADTTTHRASSQLPNQFRMAESVVKVLVVGSEGYLGSRLVPFLEARGISCDRFDAGLFVGHPFSGEFAPDWTRGLAQRLTPEIIRKYSVVVYLAAISNDPLENLPSSNIYDAVLAHTLRVAEICMEEGVQFVFPSSCSVYGFSGDWVDEDSVVNPQTAYSENKVQVEHGLRTLAASNSSFRPVALRLATVFGVSNRMRFDLVTNMFVAMALVSKSIGLNSDGSAWRPHVDIRDVMRAFYLALDTNSETPGLQVLNVGMNQNNLTVMELASLVARIARIDDVGQLRDASESYFQDRKVVDGRDSRSYRVKFDKYQSLHGSRHEFVSIEDGVMNLVDYLSTVAGLGELLGYSEYYRLQHLEKLVSLKQLDLQVFSSG